MVLDRENFRRALGPRLSLKEKYFEERKNDFPFSFVVFEDKEESYRFGLISEMNQTTCTIVEAKFIKVDNRVRCPLLQFGEDEDLIEVIQELIFNIFNFF
jgi:hypothetical protein